MGETSTYLRFPDLQTLETVTCCSRWLISYFSYAMMLNAIVACCYVIAGTLSAFLTFNGVWLFTLRLFRSFTLFESLTLKYSRCRDSSVSDILLCCIWSVSFTCEARVSVAWSRKAISDLVIQSRCVLFRKWISNRTRDCYRSWPRACGFTLCWVWLFCLQVQGPAKI